MVVNKSLMKSSFLNIYIIDLHQLDCDLHCSQTMSENLYFFSKENLNPLCSNTDALSSWKKTSLSIFCSRNEKIINILYQSGSRAIGEHSNHYTYVRVFANSPVDRGSIPGRVIPKTQKMVFDATLHNIQHYKVRIKGKMNQSWERSSALSYTSV